MIYYDLHVAIAEAEKAISRAKILGFGGIMLSNNAADALQPAKEEGFDIVTGIIINPQTTDELQSSLERARNSHEIVAVAGGDYEINRAACDDNRVDILLHPERGRGDSGMDHICAKAAADNGVSIGMVFGEILNSKNRPRSIYFMQRNVYLCKKYNTPVISVSGAANIWEMRAPRELASIAHVMGLELNEAIESVSLIPEQRIRENREKLAGSRFGEVRVLESHAET